MVRPIGGGQTTASINLRCGSVSTGADVSPDVFLTFASGMQREILTTRSGTCQSQALI
jgi:hypothetical protein